ncbi:lipase [Staphylococcus felis]|uniref:triacylglycerol lipase n=1 Tax=Staphylococcus felis TaxID=46127 RepID=A0AAX1RW18_9STAP|nr:lipase [Staphylococcus felis]REH79828.1 lipase [Staphylococcus felis]REH86005.1 lipase [Staphylococcus felis]REH86716.1 lipase [Staphylococcus felis]REH99146.1 lipase [Staphylococcus felis]REI15748.1 lipase [Staphylococcus felis]
MFTKRQNDHLTRKRYALRKCAWGLGSCIIATQLFLFVSPANASAQTTDPIMTNTEQNSKSLENNSTHENTVLNQTTDSESTVDPPKNDTTKNLDDSQLREDSTSVDNTSEQSESSSDASVDNQNDTSSHDDSSTDISVENSNDTPSNDDSSTDTPVESSNDTPSNDDSSTDTPVDNQNDTPSNDDSSTDTSVENPNDTSNHDDESSDASVENQNNSPNHDDESDVKDHDKELSNIEDNQKPANNDTSQAKKAVESNLRTATQNNTTDENKEEKVEENKVQQHQNKYPIIFVHGLAGFSSDNRPLGYPSYWGGSKYQVIKRLREEGYDVHEASVSAFGSNFDRAVELYYYIKGGTVDYGAAHSQEKGHERYGKTYEGVYKDWKPGHKVHLIGHSMGGTTIRMLEELLRNGYDPEKDYGKTNNSEVSELFQGGHDNMIASITTLATPHNGSQVADKLGNKDFIRSLVFRLSSLVGTKHNTFDIGLGQWGLSQKESESLIDYLKRIENSNLWDSDDNAFHDLTVEDTVNRLNNQTSINPNIVYNTYTGSASKESPITHHHRATPYMFGLLHAVSFLIGNDKDPKWRENDGIVPVISALAPFTQPFVKAGSTIQKGVWQVHDVMKGWDHADFVGLDFFDIRRTGAELEKFYHSLMDNIKQIEAIDTPARQLMSA